MILEYELLKKCNLFSDFSESEISKLLLQFKSSVKAYSKGQFVAFRGDVYDRLLIILKGALSAEIHSDDGKVLRIETLTAPSPVATGILYASQSYLPVSLVAVEDTTVLSIPRESITGMCLSNKTFLLNFMRDTGDKIVLFSDKVRLLQFNTIREKLASFLIDYSSKTGLNSFKLPYTVEQLAELFGTARPSVSRIFSEFISSGLIQRNNKVIIISNISGLKAILENKD